MAPSSTSVPAPADPVAAFKEKQREMWAMGDFADIATFTTQAAGHLVRFAGVRPGERVLDVGTGTGVVAITAARMGARVTGLDLTPALLEKAKASAAVAGVAVEWQEGDAERLPHPDGSFDVVLSQFGHMFAPRPEVAAAEMLRVLRPGGRIAFATWPPEQLIGRAFALLASYVPPPPGVPPPAQWGDPATVRERLGPGVRDLHFERGIMAWPALSPAHYRLMQEAKAGPFVRAVGVLQAEPERLEAMRREYDAMLAPYLQDNVVRHEYLLSRALKA
jgi:SAM-dependent methyltransferase